MEAAYASSKSTTLGPSSPFRQLQVASTMRADAAASPRLRSGVAPLYPLSLSFAMFCRFDVKVWVMGRGR